jgi:hypothetical protein
MVVAAAMLIAIAGVGGYLIGKSGGQDLTAAREAGALRGHDQGVRVGTRQGFAVGFKSARKVSFRLAYTQAYRASYRAAFEASGLIPPEEIQVSDSGQ